MVNGMESFFKQIKFKTWINTAWIYTDSQYAKLKKNFHLLPSNSAF